MRHRGQRPYELSDFTLLGFNYRMTDLQGAIGLVQLKKLDQYISERKKWAEYYGRQLADVPWLRTPEMPPACRHGWQSYVCMVDEAKAGATRAQIMERMLAKGVNTRPGTHAVHMLGYYRERFSLSPADFPASRDCDAYSMAIPLHNRMTPDDYERVVRVLHEVA
jgi:dTDP-4-amino-4,6-dideoxygalactose transaminase